MIEITNQHQEVIINLTSDFKYKSDLVLKVYKNNSNSNPTSFTPVVNDDGTLTFTVPFSSFSIGDTITKLLMAYDGTINLYDMNEGVTILLDGGVAREATQAGGYRVTFNDNKPHTIQAVYKGNREIGTVFSNKLTVRPKIPNNIDGDYKLETIRVPANQKYMEDIEWKWRLTKGGIPMARTTFKTYHFTQEHTVTTDERGIATLHSDSFTDATKLSYRNNWGVGIHYVVARFFHYDEHNSDGTVVAETQKKVKVEKNSPRFEFFEAGSVGNNAYFRLTDPQGLPMANERLIVKVNGKTYNKITADSGRVKITMNRKGHFKYHVIYAGNDNLNKKSVAFYETIT